MNTSRIKGPLAFSHIYIAISIQYIDWYIYITGEHTGYKVLNLNWLFYVHMNILFRTNQVFIISNNRQRRYSVIQLLLSTNLEICF